VTHHRATVVIRRMTREQVKHVFWRMQREAQRALVDPTLIAKRTFDHFLRVRAHSLTSYAHARVCSSQDTVELNLALKNDSLIIEALKQDVANAQACAGQLRS
jgi:hypothetical protein